MAAWVNGRVYAWEDAPHYVCISENIPNVYAWGDEWVDACVYALVDAWV